MNPRSTYRPIVAVLTRLGAVLWLAACGCGSFRGPDAPVASRVSRSGPEFRILSPVNGQVITGSVVPVQLQLRRVRLVNKVGQPNVPGECHLRVWVDSADLSDPPLIHTTPSFQITGLAPGIHHVIIELRQNDGSPLPGAPTDGERDTPVHKHVHFDTVSALARVQSEIFTPTCATVGCHVRGGAAPMPLSDPETSRAALVDVPADNGAARRAGKRLVVPGQPDQSFLIQKLTGNLQFGEGDLMPPNRPPLERDPIDLIRLWIAQGAEGTGRPRPPASKPYP
jgi:hypothetical protein